MLRVASPGALDKGHGRAHFLGASSALKHVIKVVAVAERIDPSEPLAGAGRTRSLLVEKQAMLVGEVLQKGFERGFAVFANKLPELVPCRLRHRSCLHPQTALMQGD